MNSILKESSEGSSNFLRQNGLLPWLWSDAKTKTNQTLELTAREMEQAMEANIMWIPHCSSMQKPATIPMSGEDVNNFFFKH